jgi:hypothetical protein
LTWESISTKLLPKETEPDVDLCRPTVRTIQASLDCASA